MSDPLKAPGRQFDADAPLAEGDRAAPGIGVLLAVSVFDNGVPFRQMLGQPLPNFPCGQALFIPGLSEGLHHGVQNVAVPGPHSGRFGDLTAREPLPVPLMDLHPDKVGHPEMLPFLHVCHLRKHHPNLPISLFLQVEKYNITYGMR